MSTILDYGPAVHQLRFTPGDCLVVPINMGVDITGRTYTAGINDANGALVVAMSINITDAAAGKLQASLTALQTAALQSGRDFVPLSWYFTETIAGCAKTLITGGVIMEVR